MKFRSLTLTLAATLPLVAVRAASCQAGTGGRADTVLSAASSVVAFDSAGQHWVLLQSQRYLPARYYHRGDAEPTHLLIQETAHTLCCVDGERETETSVALAAWRASLRAGDSPLWRAQVQADEGSVWDEFYRSVRFGCCDVSDEVSFFNIETGGPPFIMTARRGETVKLPFLEVPNSPLLRVIAFHDCTTLENPPEAQGDSLVVGVLQYGPRTGPVFRVVVRRSRSATLYRLSNLRFVVQGKQPQGAQTELWSANNKESPDALTGFAIVIALQPYESDGAAVTVRIPVIADKPDLAYATLPRGFSVRLGHEPGAQSSARDSGLSVDVSDTDSGTVLRFVDSLQAIVRRSDRRALARMLDYPVLAWDGTRNRRIRSEAEFLQRYDAIVSPALRRSIAAVTVDSLFSNWQGVMFDNGRVWFRTVSSGVLKIATINAPIGSAKRP